MQLLAVRAPVLLFFSCLFCCFFCCVLEDTATGGKEVLAR